MMENYRTLIHLAALLNEVREITAELQKNPDKLPDFLQLELKDANSGGLLYAIGDVLTDGMCPCAGHCRDSILCSVEGDLSNDEREIVEPILNRLKNR